MSKLSMGVLAGVAIAAAAAVPSLASPGASDITLNAGSATTQTAPAPAPVRAAAVTVKVAPKVTPKVTPKPPLPRVLKVTRVVRLVLPTTGKVGHTVTGYIQVVDSNTTIESPVPGVEVALQKKVAGSTKFTDAAQDVTDAGGQVNVSFTITANTTWRAVLKPATGKVLYSTTVVTKATPQLTWAARPDMDVTAKAHSTYAFRVAPIAGKGHLEIASSKTPTKWVAAKDVVIAPSGVVTQYVVFPTAGTWFVRGATAGTAATSAGYTTVLTVTVH